MSVLACQRCRKANNGKPADGVAECPFSGADILRHVAAGYCPHALGPLFGTAEKPPGWDDPPPPPPPAPVAPPAPVPREQWPRAIVALARRRKPEDRGAGDTAARLINERLPKLKGVPFGDAFKAWTKKHGIDCGCAERQARLNALYPYPT